MAGALPYEPVNDALNDVFFDGRFAGQPVYLSMDNGLRSEFAGRFDVDPDAAEATVCKSVSSTLFAMGDPYQKHISKALTWRRDGMRSPPPFSAVLFALSYAAELMEAEGSFASNNYYFRLCRVLGVDREKLQHYRASPEVLWIALNEWLVANGHQLGRPTARPMSANLRYVGWSISQALVRASDRDVFHDLFVRFGFSASEAISKREMLHYLDSWMQTSRPTARLKNAWNKRELRDRVAEAALAELSIWNGGSVAGSAGAQTHTIRLSLLANLVTRFPSRILELHLGYAGEEAKPAALADGTGSFQIANELFGSFATIGPSPFLAGNEALAQRHVFEEVGASRTLEWQPRLVITLAKSAQSTLWVEAARVAFGVQHLLLVRDTNMLPQKVEAYLKKAAAHGLTRATPAMLKGLPQGWILYIDVQINRTDVQPDSDDLDCLIPVGEGSVLEVYGGLQLRPGFYHSRCTPTARLVVAVGSARLEAAVAGGQGILVSAESTGPEVELHLVPGIDHHQEIALRGFEGPELVEENEIIFRDADNPTSMRRDGLDQKEYASILSASERKSSLRTAVRGMSITGELAQPAHLETVASQPATGVPTGDDEDIQEATLSLAINRHVAGERCIERGYHVWHFPAIQPGTPRGTPVEGRCTSCSRSLVLFYRRRTQAQPDSGPSQMLVAPMPEPTSDDVRPVDHDLLIDALSYLGSGSWGKFETLIESLAATPHFARQLVHNYASLGLVELELRAGSSAIASWSVPPPAINVVSIRRAFLSGFRCRELVAKIGVLVEARGGTLSRVTHDGGPTAIFIEGVGADAFQSLGGAIHDPHGRPVVVNDQPALSIATACHALPSLEADLVPVSIGRVRNLQRFEVGAGRWKDIDSVSGSGAYRWNEGWQSYAYVDAGGAARGGPYQVVKLLAARAANRRLHDYDASKRVFRSTLGCEPPGLLSRALVACSGKLPSIERGTIAHFEVAPEIGVAIMAALYGRGEKWLGPIQRG